MTARRPMIDAADPNARKTYFLGPEGTFCHAAARAYFGATTKLQAVAHIGAVFDALDQSPGAIGIVPIENAIEGSVHLTLDALLAATDLLCIGEQIVPIEQCLLSLGCLESIRSVHSHPHALAQCRHWLRQYLPDAALVHTDSTAAAAHAVAQSPQAAAIGSAFAGQRAGLQLLVRGVQDGSFNATRFVILGRAAAERTGRDKTSVIFKTTHTHGALHQTLALFADVNLCRIESRPLAGKPWKYVFFADFEGHQRDDAIAAALQHLRERQQLVRLLGSYPACPLIA